MKAWYSNGRNPGTMARKKEGILPQLFMARGGPLPTFIYPGFDGSSGPWRPPRRGPVPGPLGPAPMTAAFRKITEPQTGSKQRWPRAELPVVWFGAPLFSLDRTGNQKKKQDEIRFGLKQDTPPMLIGMWRDACQQKPSILDTTTLEAPWLETAIGNLSL